ncbi:Chromatin-remodeling complexes subunit ngg1 [Mycena venus]|uniref:Chromatin-remodeling complexes subunit ngg1 n=1 Tax=Mycena venus TaxID=2733690 RepID=A0A8H6Y8M3_9AGAR|nr:Chromatin-remodeling complexes subunit ngg1 [Mycena venus]
MRDDIELTQIKSQEEEPQDSEYPLQNGTKNIHIEYEPSHNEDSDSDEEDLVVDDGSRALLSSSRPPRSPGASAEAQRVSLGPAKTWPQIKSIVIESAPTLLFTTIGLLFTGELLDHVSRWRAMREVDQLIMIIPVVLNLKGNLEMNLSARLGTAANVGELDDPPARRSIIIGNLSLLQVQATVVSFVAAGVSLVLGLIVPRTSPDVQETLVIPRRPVPHVPQSDGPRKSGFPTFIMVASTAMTAACLSSLILGSFMCGLVVLCRRFGRDPDNIAPPIASCLGDLVTLILLGAVSSVLIIFLHTPIPFTIALPRRPFRALLRRWAPLFGAMVISSGTGIVLDLFVSRYDGFALLAVVISGLPGAVGAIFTSRLSTSLHAAALALTPSANAGRAEPSSRLVMLTLLCVTLPVEVIFLSVLAGLGWLRLPFVFVAFSVVFFCIAVSSSLLIARALTNFLWARKLDPDMYALPIHSALMDLIGQLLLVLCFEIVSLLGAKVQVIARVTKLVLRLDWVSANPAFPAFAALYTLSDTLKYALKAFNCPQLVFKRAEIVTFAKNSESSIRLQQGVGCSWATAEVGLGGKMTTSTSKLAPYSRPTSPIRSTIFKGPPDAVPATEELESLHEELKQLKAKTLERAKKAGEDLKTIEESMRRMKEREKGKAKQIEKVKRERDYTPIPDAAEDLKLVIKPRLSSQPVSSMPPSSARSSLDPRTSEESKKKKKKRKREEESEHEQEAQRPRKATPPAPHTHPPKAQKSTASTAQSAASKKLDTPAEQSGPDFSIPPAVSLLPMRPPIPPLSKPGPSKPTEVMEDFSIAKPPTQTPVTTFYTSIEPYLRPIREEDVGFLEHTGDEVEPYVMPKLGRHYLDVWAEQDAALLGATLPPGSGTPRDAPPDTFAPPTPKWDPSTLMESDLATEARGHGPLTERVLSALLPMTDATVWKGVKAAEDAMEGRPGGSAAAAARKEKMNVSDLEARIRDTMRYHGLLDTVPDYSEKVDDPIATALRHAQRELRTVVATNKARKARLAAIARDRLGYQEYLELRDSIDRNISNAYTKLQKKDGPKLAKKKKKLDGGASAAGTPVPGEGGASANGALPPPPPPCPAALGLGPDEDNMLVVPDQLRQLVETRRQWVDTVGDVFETKQRERPGLMWGFPESSVYEGVEQEVQAMLLAQPDLDAERRANKGKGKERGDAMDVG